MTRTRLPLIWTVGHSPSPDQPPQHLVPATVPGAVQLDWARAQGWPEPAYDSDVSKYGWMEDVCWRYRTQIPAGSKAPLFLVCRGADYRSEVFVNGASLYAQEGMFAPYEVDVSAYAATGATIEILIWPAPKSCASGDRNEANQSVKPAVAYGWDFHPRLIPLGLWEDTFVEARPAAYLVDAEAGYSLADDFVHAQVFCDVAVSKDALSNGAAQLHWQLRAPDGAVVVDQLANARNQRLFSTLQQPRLWWPNGQGEQALYTSSVALLDAEGGVLDAAQMRIGFKRARLIMHETQWEEPEVQTFPKGRHTSPVTLEINGRRVFAKGANWVTPDLFPGRVDAAAYAAQLDQARAANFNMLRCWGGASIQKEAFFEQCDALGIMVWQEFPLACNRYDGKPDYLAVLDAESKAIIKRLRHHVSLTLWCGGNELFNNWSKMTDQDHALRLLNSNCFQMDVERPFLMTSPMMGMAHGGYFFRRDDGAEVYQYFANSANTAYTEFGVPGSASVNLLRRIIPQSELFPPRAGTQWEIRHAFKSWQYNSWLDLHTILHYFGEPDSLEQLVERSQWLQAEGYKAIFEEARRQRPVCAMALNWVLNEPWPSAANNSLLNWPAEPKPAFAAVGQSLRGVLASARIPKFSWRGGESIYAELWLLNDSPHVVPAGQIEAWIHVGGQSLHALTWEHGVSAANVNVQGPSLRLKLPNLQADRLTLELRAGESTGSRYVLAYAPEEMRGPTQHTMGDI